MGLWYKIKFQLFNIVFAEALKSPELKEHDYYFIGRKKKGFEMSINDVILYFK